MTASASKRRESRDSIFRETGNGSLALILGLETRQRRFGQRNRGVGGRGRGPDDCFAIERITRRENRQWGMFGVCWRESAASHIRSAARCPKTTGARSFGRRGC